MRRKFRDRRFMQTTPLQTLAIYVINTTFYRNRRQPKIKHFSHWKFNQQQSYTEALPLQLLDTLSIGAVVVVVFSHRKPGKAILFLCYTHFRIPRHRSFTMCKCLVSSHKSLKTHKHIIHINSRWDCIHGIKDKSLVGMANNIKIITQLKRM